jgi:hypothetical protein
LIDGCDALKHLLTHNDEPRSRQRNHIRRAISIYRSLAAANVVERLDDPDEDGRLVRVTVDLQVDFALNQPLSPFVLEAIPLLDLESPDHALDVLSIVESTLGDPGPIIAAQLNQAKTDLINELKSRGVEYDERMAALEKVEHPKPLREFTYDLFDLYREVHPWVGDHNIRPKSVAREMYERAMGFADYVKHYKVARSEGLLLRYLGDAYKGLVQSVPEQAKTDEVLDLTEWLGELVRQVDSSLLDEWATLQSPPPSLDAEEAALERAAHELPTGPPPITANERGFRVLVRNEAFRRVELLARRDWAGLAALDDDGTAGGRGSARAAGSGASGAGWAPSRWQAETAAYFAEHGSIGIGPDARRADRFEVMVDPATRRWHVRQVIEDPEGFDEWGLDLDVDLAASDEAGQPVVVPLGLSRR